MVGIKYIIFYSTIWKLTLITLAAINECGENRDSVNDEAFWYLNNTRPLRYQVYVDPCVSDGNFSGYVNIDLVLLKPTKNISLHSQDLEFCEEGVYLSLKGSSNETFEALKPVANSEYGASSFQDSDEAFEALDDSSETVRPCKFVYYKKEQTVTMKFDSFLKPGRYSLEINYMGVINSESGGIYRKSYKDVDGENKVMLLTNFFPTSARRVFPCRDEPAIKAKIYFTMQTSLNFTTIMASAPDNYIEYKEGQRWTHFYPIMNASSYQLNFAVLNSLKNVTTMDVNKTYVTYAATSDLKMVKLAQDTHIKAMSIMENFTKMSYPLDTFINLVVPEKVDVTYSASLGFITTKKSHVLYNDRSGPQQRKDVVLRASRDIAHQWFNYLLSPISWNYMWLNEGLTDYMKYYLADKIMPNWRLKDIFVVWELQRRSFVPNKITDGPPLNKNTSNNPKDIQCQLTRSISSSSMGASIIRMMSHFLSEDVLHSAISNILKTNKYSSIRPEDFWESVQNAVNASKDSRLADIDVREIMNTWTNTEFYPVVNVTRNYTNGLITVSQVPAVTFFDLAITNITNKWWIPINYATQSKPEFNVTFPSHWLKPHEQHVVIEGIDTRDWVIFNIKQTGYYRVLYDEENWKRLVSFLNSDNYNTISPINRAQIMNDAIQFALNQQLNMTIFIDLISYLQRETDYIPWYDAQFIFSFLNYHLSNTQAYDSFKKFGLRLITPLVDKIGYEDQPNDDLSTLLLRRISNHWACYFGYEKCWNNATKQLDAYLENKKSELGSADLQDWARCVGLNGANETIWNKMLKKYQKVFSEDKLIYLACSENLIILRKFLKMAISNNSIIPEKQVLSAFKSVCLYPSGDGRRLDLCLDFINAEFDTIKLRLGNSTETFITFLDLLASEIRQKNQFEQFEKLMSQERASFALVKLRARMKQTESRILVSEQKSNYYEPFFKAKLSKTCS